MSIIYIINCGGLGNRLNNIVNGIYLSEVLERELQVIWPLNDACYCPYNNLFANPLIIKNLNSEHEPVNVDDYNQLVGEETILYNRKWPETISSNDTSRRFREYENSGLNKQLLNTLSKHTGNILLQGPAILPFVPTHDIIRILGDFYAADDLSKKINEYSKSEKIDKSVIGAHIRQTDSSSQNTKKCLKKIEKIITANSSQKILVCSDSQEIERELKLLYPDNIIIHEKTSYPEKKDAARKWDSRDQGASIYNVIRSKESVQQAIVDMYLLSKTNLTIRSQGTFSKIAHYISLSDWAKNRKRFSFIDKLLLYRVRKNI